MDSFASSRGAKLSLVSAMLFALVAIGFAAFIIFWKAPPPTHEAPKQLSIEQQENIMKQLKETPPTVQPKPGQADPNNMDAAKQLELLKQMRTAK